MADSDSTDLLIAVKPKNMTALIGEARVQFDSSDTLMAGFSAANGVSYFGAADTFTFGAGIEDEASRKEKDMHALLSKVQGGGQGGANGGSGGSGKSSKGTTPKGKTRKYANFFKTGALRSNSYGFDITLEEVTISRKLDQMSVELMKLCVKQWEIETITLVRRKAVGGALQYKMQPYLRAQFSGALLTAIDWDDGEEVTEKLKFVYRSFSSSFRTQNEDGTLAGAVSAEVVYADSDSG